MSEALTAAAAEVYRAEPDAFVRVRREQAAALDAGEPEAAAQIRALPKPVRAAWAVNVLVRRMPDRLAQLLDLGEALRAAHTQADASALRDLTPQRRRLLATVASELRALCAELGVPLGASTLDQVTQTLMTALGDENAQEAVTTGRLVRPLGPGVDPAEVTALPELPGIHPRERRPGSPLVAVPSARPDEGEGHRRAEGARAAEIRAARRRVDRLQSSFDRATTQLARQDAALSSLRTQAAQLRRQWEEMEHEVDRAGRERERTERAMIRARTALEDAVDQLAEAEHRPPSQ